MAGLLKQLESANVNLLHEIVRAIVETLIGANVDSLCSTPYGQRGPERINHRNGCIGIGFWRRGWVALNWP